MLIDDEQADQMMYRRVLKRSGMVRDQISFQYADEALAYLKKEDREEIDLILLDINMPRMNGFEFLEAATAELGPAFAKAVVVMLTTSIDPRDRERAEKFSVVRKFINKPLTIEHVEVIAKIVESEA
ncbi:histidine kinase [Leisingera sp. ANG-Vp]|nr:histidine kinase [Leisingera sp. ANG-Vp]